MHVVTEQKQPCSLFNLIQSDFNLVFFTCKSVYIGLVNKQMRSGRKMMEQHWTADLVGDQHIHKTVSLKISGKHLRRTANTYQSIAVMLFVHQCMSAAPFCHLYGRGRIKLGGGGTRDGGDASRPGLV